MSDFIKKCKNCGKSHGKSEEQCPKCGFKDIPTKDLGEGRIYYCHTCACNYVDRCPQHGNTEANGSYFLKLSK